MKMKRKIFALVFAGMTAMASVAAISPDEVWMTADFDLPMEIDGKAVYPKIDSRNIVEGKWGKAFYCHRPSVNTLPPGFYVAPTNIPAGTFTFPAQPDPMKYTWIKANAGLTWSCFVKGAKGTKVILTPTLSPVTETAIKDAKKKKDYRYTDENAVKDEVVASTNELNGAWQRIWCGVKHDCRTTTGRMTELQIEATGDIEVKCLMLESSATYPYWTLKPSKYSEGGDARKQESVMLSDPEILKDFPGTEGTASFWIRSYDDEWTWENPRVWFFSSGDLMLAFDGELRLGKFASVLRTKHEDRLMRNEKWQHVINIWRKNGDSEIWVDGILRAKSDKNALDAKTGGKYELRIGTAANGTQQGDVVIDDFAIFRRALTEAEIKELATGVKPLREGKRLFAGPVHFTFFRRHQDNAAIRFTVDAPMAGKWKIDASINGCKLDKMKEVEFKQGINDFAVPFDPSDFRVGKYDWSIRLVSGDGDIGLEKKGELEILPRRDPKAPMYMSWGGGHPVTIEFMNESGLDAANVNPGDIPFVRKLIAAGIRPNIRLENSGWWQDGDFDEAKVKAKTEAILKPFEGLCDWNTTLVNSEVYGTWVTDKATNSVTWMKMAEKAIGMKPDFRYGHAPSQVHWGKLGRTVPRGKIKHDIPALETLEWVKSRGQPVYWINRIDHEVIHAMDPDNTVWTEPYYSCWMANDVDMMADWFYCYSTDDTLRSLRCKASNSRYFKKAFMPTLSMYNDAPGRHPSRVDKDGKPEKVTMGQSCDGLVIQTWQCIAAARADNLSMFSANSWQQGVKAYAEWKTNANAKVTDIADPDAPAKYREIVKNRIMPALELMRGLDNERAKVALIQAGETDTAGGSGWAHWHYNNTIRKAMEQVGIPYDVINSPELKDSAILSKYKYALYPMNCVTYEENDRACREAAEKGTVIIQDSFARLSYPNELRIASTNFWNPKELPRTAGAPVLEFFTNRIDEIMALAPSLSDGDVKHETYTFEKRLDGVRYITVINNHRLEHAAGNGVLTTFCTNDWYRPYGAPATITTVIRNAGNSSAVYEFNATASNHPNFRTYNRQSLQISQAFAPAEGRVYCVYPEALKAPEVKYRQVSANRGTLVVTIATRSGKPAPGRTVIELTLTDPEGRITDESGRYTVDNGRVEIPIHFAAEDPEGSFLSKWKASVHDMTTGKSGSVRFSRR